MMDFAAYKIEREEIATEHKEDMPYMNVSGKRVRQNWANQLAMCTFQYKHIPLNMPPNG